MERTAGYEHISVDAHIPVLGLPGLPDRSPKQILSNAVIQGTFNPERRAYGDIFGDLIRSLQGEFLPSDVFFSGFHAVF